MRKIIPFRKEILFKTKLKEVTSISLEHDYKVDDDYIKGEFHVSGDYKITSSSINRENFNYTIPFEIDLDNKYDSKTINLDIENFYYEIIDEEILKVSIDVFVEGEYKKEKEEEQPQGSLIKKINSNDDLDRATDDKPNNNIVKKEEEIPATKADDRNSKSDNSTLEDFDNTNVNINNNINDNNNTNNSHGVNLFDNVNMEDTYATYHVYIVKEDDTIDTVLDKYNITREELENYNDISSIKYQDKLIIPSHNE